MSITISDKFRLMFSWITDRKRFPLLVTATAIVLISAAAMTVRLYAVNHYTYHHPDEEIARAVIDKALKTSDNDTNWIRTDVQKEFTYISYNFSSYYLFAAEVERLLGHTADDLDDSSVLRVHLRQLSSVLGGLCVLLTGLFGWRLGGRFCGIVAAALTACCPTLFQDSLYARPEAFVTALSMLLLLVLDSRHIRRSLVMAVSGLLMGWLLACKISLLLYLPLPLLVAPALSASRGNEAHDEYALLRWAGILAAYFVGVAVGFAVGVPYAIRFPWEYVQGLVALIVQYNPSTWNTTLGDSTLLERLAHTLLYLVQTSGFIALALALVGLEQLVAHRRVRALLLMTGPLLTLAYFMQTRVFYERNFSHALPVLFVLSGLGATAILKLVRRPDSARAALGAGLVFTSLVTPVLMIRTMIHPALDHAYLEQVDAHERKLSQNGDISFFYLTGSIKQLLKREQDSCVPYIYGANFFHDYDALRKLQAHGYQVLDLVPSVFGMEPLSSLQEYLAPSVIYLAPPRANPEDCRVSFTRLSKRLAGKPAQTDLGGTGSWTLRLAQVGPAGNSPWPIYDSHGAQGAGNDSVKIGPFQACGDIAIPFQMGSNSHDLSLSVTRYGQHGGVIVYSGTPSTPPGEWYQLVLKRPRNDCGSVAVLAVDSSASPNQWMEIGVPAVGGESN